MNFYKKMFYVFLGCRKYKMTSTGKTEVEKFYFSVIEDVIKEVKENFISEGLDESLVVQLKKIWKSKIIEDTLAITAVRESLQTSFLNQLTDVKINLDLFGGYEGDRFVTLKAPKEVKDQNSWAYKKLDKIFKSTGAAVSKLPTEEAQEILQKTINKKFAIKV